MPDANLLTVDEPEGTEVMVQHKQTAEIEEAEVDGDGIVRNDEGESYSAGAYRIAGGEHLDAD